MTTRAILNPWIKLSCDIEESFSHDGLASSNTALTNFHFPDGKLAL
jgi:hypothetical protein